jgi:hypothetical protein
MHKRDTVTFRCNDLISLDIVTMVNVNSDKITEINYKIDAF